MVDTGKVTLSSDDSYGHKLAAMFASSMYMHIDENLRITSYNALANVRLEVRYRFIDCEGTLIPSMEAQVPNTDRSAKSSLLLTPNGWLLGGEVFVSGAAPALGQTFVVVEIVRGVGSNAVSLQVIGAGYVSAKQPLQFPSQTILNSLDTAGTLRSITGTQPAAGAEINETVPTGARWELVAFRDSIVTNATAGNRTSVLFFDDGVNRWSSFPAMAVIAPSTNSAIEWAVGSTAIATINGQNAPGLIPVGLRLPAGARIRSTTANLAAGDQWGAPQYLVREWLEGS